MISVKSIWRDIVFRGLSPHSKLLYLHLSTNPRLDTIGMTIQDEFEISQVLNMELEDVMKAFTELENNELVMRFTHDKYLYIYIPNHFKTLPKVERTYIKAQEDLLEMPDHIAVAIKEKGKYPELNMYANFVKPTEEQVRIYAMEIGYCLDSEEFIGFYEERGWKDTRGRVVKNWKSKVRFWCKNKQKIPIRKEAPKGFQYFYIVHESEIIIPDYWVGEVPMCNNGSLIINMKLKEGYEKIKCEIQRSS